MQVLAVYGSWHLGQLQVGLSGAVRLAQCRSLQLTARAPLPMQIDGEPWYQSPARVSVKLQGKVPPIGVVGPAGCVVRLQHIMQGCHIHSVHQR